MAVGDESVCLLCQIPRDLQRFTVGRRRDLVWLVHGRQPIELTFPGLRELQGRSRLGSFRRNSVMFATRL